MTHHQANPPETEGRLIRWASFYDFVTSFLTFGQARRLRIITIDNTGLKPGESVLDVGCGTGGVTLPAKERVGATGKVAGIDPAPEMITVARHKAQRKKLEIDFRVGMIEALPFQDATFDAVTASLMMHHLPEQLQAKGLAEIYRVLKPGGRLLIADMVSTKSSTSQRVFSSFTLHHGIKFGIDQLLGMIEKADFREATQLEKRFFVIGFVCAIK